MIEWKMFVLAVPSFIAFAVYYWAYCKAKKELSEERDLHSDSLDKYEESIRLNQSLNNSNRDLVAILKSLQREDQDDANWWKEGK